MEKKNMVLLTVIAVATLLVAVVGATFAYFTATSTDDRNDNGDKGKTEITTADVAGKTVVANITGTAGSFIATNIYPGHMEVAGLSVTVSRSDNSTEGSPEDFTIPFIYTVTENTISNAVAQEKETNGAVKYYLYKSTKEIQNVTADSLGCQINVATGQGEERNETWYSEKCTFQNAEEKNNTTTLSSQDVTLIETGTLKGGPETIQMIDTVTLPANEGSASAYYYFVVQFENQESASQNSQMSTSLKGSLKVA